MTGAFLPGSLQVWCSALGFGRGSHSRNAGSTWFLRYVENSSKVCMFPVLFLRSGSYKMQLVFLLPGKKVSLKGKFVAIAEVELRSSFVAPVVEHISSAPAVRSVAPALGGYAASATRCVRLCSTRGQLRRAAPVVCRTSSCGEVHLSNASSELRLRPSWSSFPRPCSTDRTSAW